MKKHFNVNLFIYISLTVLCVALLGTLFFVYLFTDISSIFASIVAVLSTVIGAFASFIEYRRNTAINRCNDIMSFYSNFANIPGNRLTQYKLECLKRRDVNLFKPEDITDIRNYLLYFNGVAEAILTNNIGIKHINTILGYRFFLIMNCPYVQDLEIIPNAQMYRPCIQLHYKWLIWAKKHNFKRSGDATSLEKRFPDYMKYVEA